MCQEFIMRWFIIDVLEETMLNHRYILKDIWILKERLLHLWIVVLEIPHQFFVYGYLGYGLSLYFL